MPNAPNQGSHRPWRPTSAALSVATVLLLPALLFLVLATRDLMDRRSAVIRHGNEAAQMAAERTLRLIGLGQQALARAEDAIGGQPWAELQAPERGNALVARLRRIEQTQPMELTVFAARGDGRETMGGPAGGIGQVAGAQELPGEPRSMIFTAPGDTLSEWILLGRERPVARDIASTAAFVAWSPDLFASLWKELGQDGCSFLLVTENGDILASQGDAPAAIRAAILRRQGISGEGGIGTELSGDGTPWLVVWQRVGDLPLLMVHAVPQPSGFSALRRDMTVHLGVTFAVALVFLVVGRRVRRADRANEANLARLEASAAELRAEIERREAAEEDLRNAQRLEGLGRLTGGVAHDFNNLLTAILGTARALERHLGPRADDRSRRLIAAIVAAVQRGARLNASLLAFARRQPLMLAAVDANALLRDFLPLLRRAMDETIEVDLSLEEGLPACLADAAQLEAALLNLVINARDAISGGGAIRIATRRAWLQEQALAGNTDAKPGPYVAIEIRDTGLGMAPEVQDRAFEPFFTTKPAGQGTGLGLSQVFGFVRQIGGHVTIQSARGRGTVVTLYLPLGSGLDEARAGTLAHCAPAAPEMRAGASVLVVEDEPAVRAVAMDILREEGFDVLAAPDGPTALALLREGARVDILFSDIVMPGGMSGVELAREAQHLHPKIAVLLASGYAADALEKWGGAGEFDLIGKPYDADTLLRRLAPHVPAMAG